jgi:hypothetical protein
VDHVVLHPVREVRDEVDILLLAAVREMVPKVPGQHQVGARLGRRLQNRSIGG